MREEQEREERLHKIHEMEKRKTKRKDVEDDVFKSYKPSEDYQVLQAIRYLQGFNVFKETKSQVK